MASVVVVAGGLRGCGEGGDAAAGAPVGLRGGVGVSAPGRVAQVAAERETRPLRGWAAGRCGLVVTLQPSEVRGSRRVFASAELASVGGGPWSGGSVARFSYGRRLARGGGDGGRERSGLRGSWASGAARRAAGGKVGGVGVEGGGHGVPLARVAAWLWAQPEWWRHVHVRGGCVPRLVICPCGGGLGGSGRRRRSRGRFRRLPRRRTIRCGESFRRGGRWWASRPCPGR